MKKQCERKDLKRTLNINSELSKIVQKKNYAIQNNSKLPI